MLFLCILTCETQVHTCETQVHSCTRSATSGIPHPKFPKFCDIYILSLFLTKHYNPVFIVLERDFHHLDAEFSYLTNSHHSLNPPPPFTNGGYGVFKILNNGGAKGWRGGWKNFSINEWVKHNGCRSIKMEGGSLFQSNFGATKDA